MAKSTTPAGLQINLAQFALLLGYSRQYASKLVKEKKLPPGPYTLDWVLRTFKAYQEAERQRATKLIAGWVEKATKQK